MAAATAQTIAVLYPGQMGAALSAHLRRTMPSTTRLITELSTRSARTSRLAREPATGLELVASLDEVVTHADVALSVVVPDQALNLARLVAEAYARAPTSERNLRTYADLNAVSPETVNKVASVLTDASAGEVAIVDGGIIGGPASESYQPLIVLSGPEAPALRDVLHPAFGERLSVVGERIGQASAMKLSYASVAKGTIALCINSGLLAQSHGVLDHLKAELEASAPGLAKVFTTSVPRSVAKSFRWVGEMEEISSAMGQVGAKGGETIYRGAAGTYDFVASNDVLGKESIEESLAKGRTCEETFEELGKSLQSHTQ